jgi:hypothetical protein
MVVHDLHVVGVAAAPREADAPLIVDPNAELARAIAAQRLKAIARGNPKVVQSDRSVELLEFAPRDTFDRQEAANRNAIE